MRIAHVTATFPPYQGGTGNVCFHNACELSRLGHDVHVFTAQQQNSDENARLEDLTVHRLPVLAQVGNAPVLKGLVGGLRGFDVIHLHYPFIAGAELVGLASKLHRTPLVVSFHNDLIATGARGVVFQMYQRLSVSSVIRRAALICAVSTDHFASSRAARTLGTRCPRVAEMPNGVDICAFRPGCVDHQLMHHLGIPAHKKVILFVAALDRAHHFKGLERLIFVAGNLPEDLHIVVAGNGDLRPSYEQQAAATGVRDRISFIGAIDHSRLPALYRRASLTVLPSLPPESFGLVLIESMACGTPVVASRIPGVRTVINDGMDGYLIDPHNPGQLVDAIVAITGDECLQKRMGEAGRAKVVQRYDWRQIGKRLEQQYVDLIPAERSVSPSTART